MQDFLAFPLELKALEPEKRSFHGCRSAFENRGQVIDFAAPGAFKANIGRKPASPILFRQDRRQSICVFQNMAAPVAIKVRP